MHHSAPTKQAVWFLSGAFVIGLVAGCGGDQGAATSAKDVPPTVLQDETRPIKKPAGK